MKYTCDGGKTVDIDVKPGVSIVEISCDMDMKDSTKRFPDVVQLEIAENVTDINIPNTLFPNVKNVVSQSPAFFDGQYLIKNVANTDKTGKIKVFGYHGILLNVFCHDEDERIELPVQCQEIAAYAFKDCDSLNITTVRYIQKCDKDAFTGSAFDSQPFVNGVKMAGCMLLAIDETADIVDIPDYDRERISIIPDVSNVKHIITHNEGTFFSSSNNTFPEKLTLDLHKKWKVKADSNFFSIV